MEKSKAQFCFTHSSGEDIYLFTLSNTKGTEVCITNYGAIITSFKIKQADGDSNDIVLGFDKVEDYLSEEYLAGYPYFGAAIGRYANRIKDAEFSIDDKKYRLQKNKVTDHLHGGDNGFDKKVWSFVSGAEKTLTLKYKSIDGEEGYPGNLETKLRFELTDTNELIYEYTAATNKPTAVNLTHHSYFNLNNGKGSIDDHLVKINAASILGQDNNFIVTGKALPVANTIYDFKKARRIDESWNADDGYDQTYLIENTNSGEPVAEAYSERSGITLQVFTSEPVVHFYTGKWIPPLKGKNSNKYGPFSGLCFETHKHPNSVNIPDFPNTILRPGEIYHTKTIYRVTLTHLKSISYAEAT
ncbi:MAG TPA: aldose epimerase family protein [Chitinophagaceae bacterium]|nr:aldose epimerase family protein [Chitinophagaceae bacterium]